MWLRGSRRRLTLRCWSSPSIYSSEIPPWRRSRCCIDHRVLRGSDRVRPRRVNGHGAGRDFLDWNARVVGVARERETNLSRGCSTFAWRWECWPRARSRRFWRLPSSWSFALGSRESRLVLRTFWLPGILLFCAIALPWYFAVQMRNPQFFREFILQHNLARFSSDLYHHRQPFWYYLPVTALALCALDSVCDRGVRGIGTNLVGGTKSVSSDPDLELQFRVFVCCWLVVPVAFFSISQSKLPGYILPAIPAGAVLLADYLRRHLAQEDKPVPRALVVLHALVAAAPIVPVGADCLCHHTVPVASGTPHVHCASRRFRAMCRHCNDTGKPVAAADASFCNPDSRGVVGRGGLEVRSYIDRSDNFPRARWQQNSPRSRPISSPSRSMAFPARWNTGSRFTATKRRCATRREASRPRNICWSLRRRGR